MFENIMDIRNTVLSRDSNATMHVPVVSLWNAPAGALNPSSGRVVPRWCFKGFSSINSGRSSTLCQYLLNDANSKLELNSNCLSLPRQLQRISALFTSHTILWLSPVECSRMRNDLKLYLKKKEIKKTKLKQSQSILFPLLMFVSLFYIMDIKSIFVHIAGYWFGWTGLDR